MQHFTNLQLVARMFCWHDPPRLVGGEFFPSVKLQDSCIASEKWEQFHSQAVQASVSDERGVFGGVLDSSPHSLSHHWAAETSQKLLPFIYLFIDFSNFPHRPKQLLPQTQRSHNNRQAGLQAPQLQRHEAGESQRLPVVIRLRRRGAAGRERPLPVCGVGF